MANPTSSPNTKEVQEKANILVNQLKKGEKTTEPLTPAIEEAAKAAIDALSDAEKLTVQSALAKLKSETTDPLGALAWQTVLEKDLKDELQVQLKTMDGKLEKMSSEDLDSALSLTSSILNLTWIKKIPGFKEKGREILQYEPMLQGIAGATLLKKLQKLGYSLYFTGANQIKIVSTQKDAQDVETKINAHLAKSTVLGKSIQSGLLYLSPSFHTYRASVTNNEGKIIDPAHVDMQTYTEYLRKKPENSLDPNEKVFLQSAPFFDKNISFQSALTQSRDYAKLVGMVEQITGDIGVKDLLPKTPAHLTSRTPSIDNSVAAQAGRGIGWLAGIVGKIAGAGAGGGLEFLGTAMSEAWPLGSMAIIGAILWSIFSDKWLGFMGTLGAIFGVGLLTKAGELKDILPKWKDKWVENPAASALAASAGSPWAQQTNTTKEITQSAKLLTPTALIAQSLGKENIYDADVAKEQGVINAIKWMNAEKLQTALTTGQEADWKAAIASTGIGEWDPGYEELTTTIASKNSSARGVMTKYVAHLMNNEYVQALTLEQRQSKSIEQIGALIVEKENEKKKEAPVQVAVIPVETVPWVIIPKWTPIPDSIIKDNAGYGDLIVLSRMIEYGYLPKVNFSAGEVVAKEWWTPRFLKGAIYVGLAGPVTNNAPGANWFSGKHRHYEADFFNYLTSLIKSESAEIKTRQQAAWSFQPLHEELYSRRNTLNKLEQALAAKDPKAIKEAMKQYREAAKTPWYAGHIDNKKEFLEKESSQWKEINQISQRIEAEHTTMINAQNAANVEWATDAQKKTALDATEKYNKTLIELETNGVKILSQLPPAERIELSKTNPWVAKVAAANGGMAAFDAKLTQYSTKGISKWIMGVGLVWLLWNHQGGVADLYNKWDYITLSKLGWDFVAGVIPLVSTVHETAMLSNGLGYRDFVLGKWYEMGTLEKWFRVAGAIPLGGLVTKTVGKVAISAGEHAGISAVKKSGQMIEWISDIVVAWAKTAWQVGTYGVLGYSAVTMTYDLSNQLRGNEARPESWFAEKKSTKTTV